MKNENTKEPSLYIINENYMEEKDKIFCEIFLHIGEKVNPKRAVAFLDTGANSCVIHESYILKLLGQNYITNNKLMDISEGINTYSDNNVKVLYSLKLNCKFNKKGDTVPMMIHILPDITHVPKFVIGTDFMKNSRMHIGYTGDIQDPVPEIKVHTPLPILVNSYHVTTYETFTCTAQVHLQGGETKSYIFDLNPASTCVPGDKIMIDHTITRGDVQVTASRTNVLFNEELNCYQGRGLVHNLSQQAYRGLITAEYEILTNERCIPVTRKNLHKLMNYNLIHEVIQEKAPMITNVIQLLQPLPPLGHLTKIQKESFNITMSTPRNISRPDNKNLKGMSKNTKLKGQFFAKEDSPGITVNEKLDYKSLGIKENNIKDITPEDLRSFSDPKHTIMCGPDYVNKVDLTEDMIEPGGQGGLEIPHCTWLTPVEIVKPENYEEPHRSYIRKIFVEDYPQILAKHPLDIGNLSNTLGTYRIQLKKGEVLPPHKRTYYMSPPLMNHLRELLDYYEKAGILERVPLNNPYKEIGQDWGSPTFLIPRSRPHVAARLITDYRLLNNVIASEINIIPDMKRLFHDLRGAILYSKFDFSQAFPNLRISDDSM